MARREFFKWLAGATASGLLPSCAAGPTAPVAASLAGAAQPSVGAICFDLFTLFDPRSVVKAAQALLGERATEFCAAWRSRQFEYSWLHAAADRYVDFRQVTDEALTFAARERQIPLSSADRAQLLDAYTELEPWPDSADWLTRFQRAGLKLAPLANYTPDMIRRLLDRAGLSALFDAQLSTDAARTFKPHPRAYALGPSHFGLPRERIVFAAFGGWDAAGAKWFGFPTFWLNRLELTQEGLAPGPDATGRSMSELGAFVSSRQEHG